MLRRSSLLMVGAFFVGNACVGDDPASSPLPGDRDAGASSSSSSSGDATPGQTWQVAVASPVSVVRGKSVKLALTVTGTVSSPLQVQVQNATGFTGNTTLSASATTGALDLQVGADRPFGAATVPLSVSDGVHTQTVEAVVNVKGTAGTIDETFGQGGSILAPDHRGCWFFPTGSTPTLHWVGPNPGDEVVTAVRRYQDDGTLDPAYGNEGFTTWSWTGERGQDMRELFGSPLVQTNAQGGLELFGGYEGDNDFSVHVRSIPANAQGEAKLLQGTDVKPASVLSLHYRAYNEPDALARLPDGRIVTVGIERSPAKLVASVWNNGVLDTTWPGGGTQSTDMGTTPQTVFQSILITSTHIYVGGHSIEPAESAVFAFALNGSGWRQTQQMDGAPGGLSHFTATSDGKVHALVGQGTPGGAVNLHVATLKTETIGAGSQNLAEEGALNYAITHRGVLTAGLAGSTIWARRDTAAPHTILIRAANPVNQPLDSFGTNGELKLDMAAQSPALLLNATAEAVMQAVAGPDERLYLEVQGDDVRRLYRIWL